jgi:hypothetical protein
MPSMFDDSGEISSTLTWVGAIDPIQNLFRNNTIAPSVSRNMNQNKQTQDIRHLEDEVDFGFIFCFIVLLINLSVTHYKRGCQAD